MTRLRILNVLPSLNRAGAEYSLLFASAELARRGHDVEICSLHAPHDLAPEFSRANLRVHQLSFDTIRYNQRVTTLSEIINKGYFDVVRTLMPEASMWVALTRPFATRPARIPSFHSMDFDAYPVDRPSRRAYRSAYGLLMRQTADTFVAISEAVAKHHIEHLNLPQVDVIWNGFPIADLQRQATASRTIRAELTLGSSFVVVCPARLASDKGHEYLIHAIASLVKQGQQPLVLLFGNGPRESELRALTRTLQIEDRVRFMGTVPQERLIPIVAAADVLVLPTPRGEGFGRVLAEAMAVGTTVVTPGIAGALDFVDAQTGILVEPASGDAIANALLKLMTVPDLAPRLSAAAKARIERNFDIQSCCDKWESLFARVLDGPRFH